MGYQNLIFVVIKWYLVVVAYYVLIKGLHKETVFNFVKKTFPMQIIILGKCEFTLSLKKTLQSQTLSRPGECVTLLLFPGVTSLVLAGKSGRNIILVFFVCVCVSVCVRVCVHACMFVIAHRYFLQN